MHSIKCWWKCEGEKSFYINEYHQFGKFWFVNYGSGYINICICQNTESDTIKSKFFTYLKNNYPSIKKNPDMKGNQSRIQTLINITITNE